MHTFKVVSDLICPWCYIGKRRLEAALRQLTSKTPVTVCWHPFQLNPDMPARGMDRSEYRMRKFGDWEHCQAMDAQLTEVGKSVGLDLRLDLQDNTPNTFDSHRVIWLGGKLDVQDAVVEALFRAYFCEGVNLSSRTTLVDVAVSAGLERNRLEQMFSSEEGVTEVKSEEQAVKILGLSSVPLFIVDDCVAVSGAQPPEALLKALEQAEDLLSRQRRTRESLHPSCSQIDS